MNIFCSKLCLIVGIIGAFLSACSSAPDLRGETVGSLAGAAALGVGVASVTSELTALGAGIITGSVFGGMIGQEHDNFSPLQREDPLNDPVPLFYYKTVRAPIVYQRFYPALLNTKDS